MPRPRDIQTVAHGESIDGSDLAQRRLRSTPALRPMLAAHGYDPRFTIHHTLMPTHPTARSPEPEALLVHTHGERFRLYLSRTDIAARVQELGANLDDVYRGRTPILVGALNGSFVFMADLIRAMSIECEVDFLKLSSYGARKVSQGHVFELKKIDANLEGRDVIIVEDIVDTGVTMRYIVDRMREHEPASVRIVTLLRKPDAAKVKVAVDFVGFDIPDLFVIGYGLDHGQLGRNLPDIYILDKESSTERRTT